MRILGPILIPNVFLELEGAGSLAGGEYKDSDFPREKLFLLNHFLFSTVIFH